MEHEREASWSRRLRGATIATMLGLASCSGGAPSGATTQGRDIDRLWNVFLVAAIGVAGIVVGLILWCVVRYRRRSDELPPQFRQHIPLEVVYTAVPVLIVVVLFILTFRTEDRIDALSRDPAVVIHVTGFDWQWRFDYERMGVSVVGSPQRHAEMVVPSGETVRIVLGSSDVIHSFYVPAFLFKRDAIPGRTTEFDFVAPHPGTYLGECAEFCGLDHAEMTFTVRVVTPSEFAAWLESTRASEAAAP